MRPSRGPRASRACPGHPRSRAAQVVRAPGIFPHRAAPRRSPAFSAETQVLPRELASGFSEIPGWVFPELRDCLTKTLGSSALTPKISVLPPLKPQCLGNPDPRLALPRVGDTRILGNPAPFRPEGTQGLLTSWRLSEHPGLDTCRVLPSNLFLAFQRRHSAHVRVVFVYLFIYFEEPERNGTVRTLSALGGYCLLWQKGQSTRGRSF